MIWVYTAIGLIVYLLAFCLVFEGIKEHTTWPGRRQKYSKAMRLLGALFWPLLGFYQISRGFFSLLASTISDIFTREKGKGLYFTLNGREAFIDPEVELMAGGCRPVTSEDVKAEIYKLVQFGGRCGIFEPEEKLFRKFEEAVTELQKEGAIRVLVFSSANDISRWPGAHDKFLIVPKGMELRDWTPEDAMETVYI